MPKKGAGAKVDILATLQGEVFRRKTDAGYGAAMEALREQAGTPDPRCFLDYMAAKLGDVGA